MIVSDHLNKDNVLTGVHARSRWELIDQLLQAAVKNRQVRGESRAASETVVTTNLRRQGIRLSKIKKQTFRGAKIVSNLLNFARAGIVDDAAITEALDAGKLGSYVCDFPSNALKGNPRVLALPHLGASTNEAEDNCAVMAAQELRDYLENGNITNSVNFPEAQLHAKEAGEARLAIASDNGPDTVAKLTGAISAAGLAVRHMVHKSRGDLDYTLIDVPAPVPADVADNLRSLPGVRNVRVIA